MTRTWPQIGVSPILRQPHIPIEFLCLLARLNQKKVFETLCRPSILANILAIYWLISPMNIAPVSLYIFLTKTTATAEELHSSSRRAEAITCSYAGVQASTIRCQFWRAHEDLPSRIYRAGPGPGKSGKHMKTPLSWRIFQLAIFDWRVPQFVNTLTKDIPKTWIAQL